MKVPSMTPTHHEKNSAIPEKKRGKKIVVFGGYGEIGKVVVIDLLETFNGEVIVAGRDTKKAQHFACSFKNKKVRWAKADITHHKKLVHLLKEGDVVINAAQYTTNLSVMAAALDACVHYVDLGGLFHMTRKQLKLDKMFKRAGITAILGCGATPGITNVMAAYGCNLFDKVHSIDVQFADKDYTTYTMPLVVPYSMRTIFDEFSQKPTVFSHGKFTFVEPLSGSEEIPFPPPLNRATCFYTLHSEVATFPISFKAKGIQNCSFKGGFDAHFVEKIKFLIDTGLASQTPVRYSNLRIVPRDFTVQMLNRFIPQNDKVHDIEFLRVEIQGIRRRKNKKLIVYCKTVSNKKWNIPAGSWDTGTSPSIIAQMIVGGFIPEKGVLPPEVCVKPALFFKELTKRKIVLFTEECR